MVAIEGKTDCFNPFVDQASVHDGFAASVIAALVEKQTLRQAYGKAMTYSRLATL